MNAKLRFANHREVVRCCHSLAYLLLLSLPATAAGPWDNLFGCLSPVPDCIGKWCPDDYCAKKEPCVSVPLCLGSDDYCAKRAPCVRDPLCFGCDDYCGKCPPKVCSSPLRQIQNCGPSYCYAKSSKLPCDGYVATKIETKEQLRVDNNQPLVKEDSPALPQPFPAVFVGAADFKRTR